MTDHADLIARLRARATRHSKLMGNYLYYGDAGAALDREAADALSRPVTGEMVERGARAWANWFAEPMDDDSDANRAAVRECVRAILTAALGEPAAGSETRPTGHVEIAHDGFAGDIIGYYTTREGKRGVVVQQDGTRVVHVYGEKWLQPSLQKAQGSPADNPAARTGALGMKYGDRVEMDGRFGKAGEFFHDGEVEVHFDDGQTEIVKWGRIRPASLFSRPPAAGPETYPGHASAAGLSQPTTEKGGDANSSEPVRGSAGPDNAQPRSPDTAGGAESLLCAACGGLLREDCGQAENARSSGKPSPCVSMAAFNEAADALSRPAVTEEMVERIATTLADYMAGVRDAEDWAIAQRGVRAILTAALGTSLQKAQGSPPEGAIGETPLAQDTAKFSRLSKGTGVDASRPSHPPAAGPETYPGHDPAAGLPQPDTALPDREASIRAEATAKERERAAERMNAAYSEWWRLGNEHGERFAAWKRGGEEGPMPESCLGSLPDYLAAAIRGGGND